MERDRKKVFKGNLEQLTEGIVPHVRHEKQLQARTRWCLEGPCKEEFCTTKLRTQKKLFYEKKQHTLFEYSEAKKKTK